MQVLQKNSKKKQCHKCTNEKLLHKIRSTYISLLRDAGLSFEKIAEEVGHKSVITTMLNYSFDTLEDEENKRIINKGLNIHTA